MRQILIGAWLILASSAVAACNGEAFAPGEASSANDDSSGATSSSSKGGSAGRSGAGTSNTSTTGGTSTSSGGQASAGSSAVVPPGAAGSSAGSGGSASGGDQGVDEECPEGKVTFKMQPGADLPHDYLCDASCGTGWLTITDYEGASALTIFSACGTASCESCEVLPCAAAACLPTPLTAEGTQLSWTGTYLKQDTCGADMACQRQTCVPPGKYKAKACAHVNAGTNGASSCMPKDGVMLCAEAEFDFPSTSEVVLVLNKP